MPFAKLRLIQNERLLRLLLRLLLVVTGLGRTSLGSESGSVWGWGLGKRHGGKQRCNKSNGKLLQIFLQIKVSGNGLTTRQNRNK